jgi:hypothetical protein
VVLKHPVDPASLAEKSPVDISSTYGGSQQHPDERLYLACSIAYAEGSTGQRANYRVT